MVKQLFKIKWQYPVYAIGFFMCLYNVLSHFQEECCMLHKCAVIALQKLFASV